LLFHRKNNHKLNSIVGMVVFVLSFLGSVGLGESREVIRKINAEGTVELKGISRSVATRKAIEEAQKNAVLQIISQNLDEETLTANMELIETKILAVYANYIRNYQIGDERRSGSNLIVNIKADVWVGTIIRDLQKNELLEIVEDENAKKMVEIAIGQPDHYKKIVQLRANIKKQLEGIDFFYTTSLSKDEVVLILALNSNGSIEKIQKFLESQTLEGSSLKVVRASNDRLEVTF